MNLTGKKKITDYYYKHRFAYFCRKEKIHPQGGFVWVLETVLGRRTCKHEKIGRGIERDKWYLKMCSECKTHITPASICLLKDTYELDKRKLAELERELMIG